MNLHFSLVAILLLFCTTSYCFPNVFYPSTFSTSTPSTVAYNTATAPLYHATIPNTSTSSKFNEPSEIGSTTSNEPSLLDYTTLTNGSQRTISELKCGEYAEEIAESTETLSVSVDNMYELGIPIRAINYCKLFKKNIRNVSFAGKIVSYREYPHMVALGKYNSDGVFILICGGTLISHNWVLTAAQCTHAPNGAPSDVRMGMNRLTGQRHSITRAIKNIVRHPDYNPPALYADIALMELATPVMNFSLLIQPACLYQQFDVILRHTYAPTITEWDAIKIDGESSGYLRHNFLHVIDNLKCKIQYNTSEEIPHGIKSSMLCAIGEDKRDACHGDSGGPLQIAEKNCIYHIIGITSFGRSCEFINSPDVYTRVSHYVPWIETIVWPQQK